MAATIIFPQFASAAVLIEYQGTTYIGVTNQNQPLSKVVVGPADVDIGGFGVFGQAIANGNVKFIIFDSTQLTIPVFLSAAQAVVADPGTFANEARWYDSPTIDFTLLAGHTYAMGLISDQVGTNSFRWGASNDSPFGPGPGVTQNGLTLAFMQSLANSGEVGIPDGDFVNPPYLYTVNNSNRRQMALHILDQPEPIPTPEPLTMTLLGSGIVGMGLMRRRNKAS